MAKMKSIRAARTEITHEWLNSIRPSTLSHARIERVKGKPKKGNPLDRLIKKMIDKRK